MQQVSTRILIPLTLALSLGGIAHAKPVWQAAAPQSTPVVCVTDGCGDQQASGPHR